MSDVKFVKIALNDLFDYRRGVVISKDYVNKNRGVYPVYSSQTENEGVMGHIDSYMYDGEYITWTTDGIKAGTSFYRNGKFNCTNVCGIMMLKNNIDNIDLNYVNKLLNLKAIAKSSGNKKVMTDNIIQANLKISIPIKEDGSFDLNEQKKIADRWQKIEDKKRVLCEYKTKLETSLIQANFAENYNHKEVRITELFNPENGNGKYTKTYCVKNKGKYPVYSGNTVEEFAYINEYDYNGKYLTWAKDGLAGYIMCLEGKFSVTNHRGILITTDMCKDIDLEYIKYILEPIFRQNVKGRVGHDGKNEYTTLNGTMIKSIETKLSIPIKGDGSFDLGAQREIAEKYKKIEKTIEAICDKIDHLISIEIDL